jgi:hypothetical protein
VSVATRGAGLSVPADWAVLSPAGSWVEATELPMQAVINPNEMSMENTAKRFFFILLL